MPATPSPCSRRSARSPGSADDAGSSIRGRRALRGVRRGRVADRGGERVGRRHRRRAGSRPPRRTSSQRRRPVRLLRHRDHLVGDRFRAAPRAGAGARRGRCGRDRRRRRRRGRRRWPPHVPPRTPGVDRRLHRARARCPARPDPALGPRHRGPGHGGRAPGDGRGRGPRRRHAGRSGCSWTTTPGCCWAARSSGPTATCSVRCASRPSTSARPSARSPPRKASTAARPRSSPRSPTATTRRSRSTATS